MRIGKGPRTVCRSGRRRPRQAGRVGGSDHAIARTLQRRRVRAFGRGPCGERRTGEPLPAAWKARIAANDLAALQAAVAEDRPDISAALAAGPERRFLFYVGAKDPLCDSVARDARFLPGACYFEVAGCNHLTALLRTDLMLPRVLAFLSHGEYRKT